MTRPPLRGLVTLGAAVPTCLPFVLAAWLSSLSAPTAREQHRVGFVDSASCAICRAGEAAGWREGDHAGAMGAAAPGNVLGDFSGVTVTYGRRTATFRREGDRYVICTDGPGGMVADFTITETFDVDPLQQYLVLFPDGRRQVLPWAWDSRPCAQGGSADTT